MKYFIFAIMAAILCSCTMSINIIHTQGTADDVVEESQSARANIAPQVNVPAV